MCTPPGSYLAIQLPITKICTAEFLLLEECRVVPESCLGRAPKPSNTAGTAQARGFPQLTGTRHAECNFEKVIDLGISFFDPYIDFCQSMSSDVSPWVISDLWVLKPGAPLRRPVAKRLLEP
jgi:hypothetical protein